MTDLKLKRRMAAFSMKLVAGEETRLKLEAMSDRDILVDRLIFNGFPFDENAPPAIIVFIDKPGTVALSGVVLVRIETKERTLPFERTLDELNGQLLAEPFLFTADMPVTLVFRYLAGAPILLRGGIVGGWPHE